jgi:hypothetical protein
MRWNHSNLELCWFQSEFGKNGEDEWTQTRGLVWSRKPVYCAASVQVYNNQYSIYTTGWRGLSPCDLDSLDAYLRSLNFTPLTNSEPMPNIYFKTRED